MAKTRITTEEVKLPTEASDAPAVVKTVTHTAKEAAAIKGFKDFSSLDAAEKIQGASAKTTKIDAINAGDHKYAGPMNVEVATADGKSTEGFYNGSHNESERFGNVKATIAGTPVTPPVLTGITVKLTPDTIAAAGTSTVSLTAVPAGADITSATIKSGTVAAATISGTTITGVATGTSVITATVGSISGTATITVS